MLRPILHKSIDRMESYLGDVPLDYQRYMADHAKRALFKFSLILPLSAHRGPLPHAAAAVAHIIAARSEDCGTCVQIAVNEARKQKVDPAIVQAVLDERVADLGEELAQVYRFATAVTENAGEPVLEPLRQDMIARFGEAGLVALSTSIAAGQVFPVTKRGMGFATSCSAVEVQV